MKKFFQFTIAATLFCSTLSAQKIKIEKDIASVDGKEFVIMKDIGNIAEPSFIINSMNGDELMSIISDTKYNGYFFVTFPNTDYTGLMRASIPLRKTIIKEILRLDLVKNGELNLAAVERFAKMSDRKEEGLMIHGDHMNKPAVAVGIGYGTRRVPVIERQTQNYGNNYVLFVGNGNVKINGKNIGTYEVSRETINFKLCRVITVMNSNGVTVAKVTKPTFEEETEIFSFQDNSVIRTTINKSNELKENEDIMRRLIELNIL